MIRVAVIAPTPAIRSGLRALLNAADDIEVVVEAVSLAAPAACPPDTDVVVVAVETPDTLAFDGGLGQLPDYAGLLVLSGDAGEMRTLLNLAPRPWGWLTLDASEEELATAVRALHEGLVVLAPGLVQSLASRRLLLDEGHEPQPETLTEREMEVLELLAQGLANKQIAAELDISEHTVKFHVSSIYSKLGATNRAEAVRLGARWGLIAL